MLEAENPEKPWITKRYISHKATNLLCSCLTEGETHAYRRRDPCTCALCTRTPAPNDLPSYDPWPASHLGHCAAHQHDDILSCLFCLVCLTFLTPSTPLRFENADTGLLCCVCYGALQSLYSPQTSIIGALAGSHCYFRPFLLCSLLLTLAQ